MDTASNTSVKMLPRARGAGSMTFVGSEGQPLSQGAKIALIVTGVILGICVVTIIIRCIYIKRSRAKRASRGGRDIESGQSAAVQRSTDTSPPIDENTIDGQEQEQRRCGPVPPRKAKLPSRARAASTEIQSV